MGFREVKRKVMDSLSTGQILHEQRGNIDVKNLLATGEVEISEAEQIIARSKGGNYYTSPHHVISSVDVHILSTNHNGQSWYIKWYFIDPNSIFISVHH